MKLIICTRHSSPKYQLSILISLNSFISFRYFEWTDRTFASRDYVSYEVTSRSGEQKKVTVNRHAVDSIAGKIVEELVLH